MVSMIIEDAREWKTEENSVGIRKCFGRASRTRVTKLSTWGVIYLSRDLRLALTDYPSPENHSNYSSPDLNLSRVMFDR